MPTLDEYTGYLTQTFDCEFEVKWLGYGLSCIEAKTDQGFFIAITDEDDPIVTRNDQWNIGVYAFDAQEEDSELVFDKVLYTKKGTAVTFEGLAQLIREAVAGAVFAKKQE